LKARWQNANYEMIHTVERHRLANHLLIRGIAPPPQTVSEYHDAFTARAIFLLSKDPTGGGKDTQDVKEL
jgi:hypothetical protein